WCPCGEGKPCNKGDCVKGPRITDAKEEPRGDDRRRFPLCRLLCPEQT
ncbi:hypothetical protein GBF38_002343, partial [Nibea albiflora]